MKNKIVAIGSIAIDEIQTIKGSKSDLVGGSATYFSVASSKYNDVKLIGVVGEDFPQKGWDLFESTGVSIDFISVEKGSTFRWGGKYSEDYSKRETLYTHLGVFENFSPIISESVSTDYLYLGNIHPALQLETIKKIDNKKRIVSDTMNLWIDLDPDGVWKVVEKSDIFFLNDEEAFELTNGKDLYDIGRKFISHGPDIVVIKKGAKGSLLFTSDKVLEVPVFDKIDLLDPTGAGDSFAGGFIGYMSKFGEKNLEEALVHATAMASYTVSGFGVEGLLSYSKNSFESRLNYIKSKI
ncbi:MAG: sugar kinase [Candidatus Marinimicrobia bacterium]|nr:sugar kinase [Candidatus Neomarinimicrobiota bacterium]|tara:strand:- start:1695 stop:2582 length:888 start_codon:yes stop_codon:yes gene_type:complete